MCRANTSRCVPLREPFPIKDAANRYCTDFTDTTLIHTNFMSNTTLPSPDDKLTILCQDKGVAKSKTFVRNVDKFRSQNNLLDSILRETALSFTELSFLNYLHLNENEDYTLSSSVDAALEGISINLLDDTPINSIFNNYDKGNMTLDFEIYDEVFTFPSLDLLKSSSELTFLNHEFVKCNAKDKKLCLVDGCSKRSRSRRLCISHGGGRRCAFSNCSKSSQTGLFCIRHGGGQRCSFESCLKAAQSNNLCKLHGGGARCGMYGCQKSSQGRGFCRLHGGGKTCAFTDCKKGAQRGNFCSTHGGSRLCTFIGCSRNDRGGGMCAKHGGGRRCGVNNCSKPCRRQGLCSLHLN